MTSKYDWSKHVLEHKTLAEDIEYFEFKIPGTGFYSMFIFIHKGRVLISGDKGSSIMNYDRPVSIYNLNGIDLNYFCGKCCASEVGHTFKEFDIERAKTEMLTSFQEDHEDMDEKKLESDLIESIELIENEHQFYAWMQDYGYKYFGSEWYEYSFGIDACETAKIHASALQEISKRMREKDENGKTN